MEISEELSPGKEFSSTMIKKTGGAEEEDARRRRLEIHVVRIRKYFMILVKINKTSKNTVYHTQLPMEQDS